MADLLSHIRQAKHNEECANWIVQRSSSYRDWAITAAFYAAVHFAEACFSTQKEIGHTETAPDRAGQEPHKYRIHKIDEKARPAYKSYKKLYDASNNVRYLTNLRTSTPIDYYDLNAVKKMVEEDLPLIRSELGKAFGIKLD